MLKRHRGVTEKKNKDNVHLQNTLKECSRAERLDQPVYIEEITRGKASSNGKNLHIILK